MKITLISPSISEVNRGPDNIGHLHHEEGCCFTFTCYQTTTLGLQELRNIVAKLESHLTAAVLKDEVVPGQGRAAGRMVRKIVSICVGNYNLVIAEGSDPANPVGKKFFGKLTHLARGLTAHGSDEEFARKQMLSFFKKYSGEPVGDLTWAEMDEKFQVSKRCKDSSGKLQLYPDLKEKGWEDEGAAE